MKRTIQLALALLTIAALLIGCAAPAAPAAPAAAGGETTATGEAAQPAADAQTAASGEKTKIVWWGEGSTVDATSQQAVQEQVVDAFNAEHPNIELEIVWQQNNNETLRAALQAGQGPDIAQTPGPGYLLEYQKAGFLLPLNDFATENGWEKRILPWAYASGVVDGTLYGLPLTFESMFVLYNTAVFKELGLQPPTNRRVRSRRRGHQGLRPRADRLWQCRLAAHQ